MKNVQFFPFDVNINGIGVFPNLRYPRVIWAGITKGSNQLSSISMQLNKQLHNIGFTSDSRSFSPHITFARIKSGKIKSEISNYLKKYVNYKFGIIRAECLVLKKSDLTPKGAIYSTLKSYCP
jgi:2'-5' RNA ligase